MRFFVDASSGSGGRREYLDASGLVSGTRAHETRFSFRGSYGIDTIIVTRQFTMTLFVGER